MTDLEGMPTSKLDVASIVKTSDTLVGNQDGKSRNFKVSDIRGINDNKASEDTTYSSKQINKIISDLSSLSNEDLTVVVNAIGDLTTLLNSKADTEHTHTISQITDMPTSMKNPSKLTINLNNQSNIEYDGEEVKEIDITAENIGAAKADHTHRENIYFVSGIKDESNNYNVTLDNITEYYEGLTLCLKVDVNSVGESTLKINELEAIPMLDSEGNQLEADTLKAEIPYHICYCGTNFIVLGKGGDKGIDVSDATALEEDILINKSAYGPNGKIEGAMVNNVAVDIVLDTNNKEYTVPKGFHNGLGKIKAVITNLIASVIKYGSVVGGITGTFTGDATATAAQMLSGVIAYVKGNKIVGTMANRGAPTNGLNCGGVYNIADGYYSGGSITANSLASQTPANATAAQILAGYTAWVNGNLINGNSPNFQQNVGSFTIAPKQTGSINLGFIPDILILKISTTAALYDLYIYCNLFSITSKKSGGSYTTVDSSISDYISGTILSKYNSSINSTITCEYKAYKM